MVINMDFITKIKNFLNKLYSNGFFKSIVFCLFFILVLYKYSNIRNINIGSFGNKNSDNDSFDTVEKISPVKTIRDEVYIKLDEKKKRNERLAQLAKENEMAKMEAEARKEKIEEVKKEFTPKLNKTGRVVKHDYIVTIKMVTTNGDVFSSNMQPITVDLPINESNPFAQAIIGKRVGDVVTMTAKEVFESKTMKDSFDKIKDDNLTKDDINNFTNAIKNSDVLYRIKIVDIKSEK